MNLKNNQFTAPVCGQGGYTILDFRDVSLSDTATVIDGIWTKIQNSRSKAFYLGNLNIGGLLITDQYSQLIPSADGKSVTASVFSKKLTVTDGDEVSIV